MKQSKRTIAVVPAKATSTRVPDKNFRDFYEGKSLVQIKIDQLLASGMYDDIYLSSDHENAAELARKTGVKYVYRDPIHASDVTPWHETFTGILKSLGETAEDVDVSWTPATNPLFSRFREVIEEFNKLQPRHDSVFTTSKFQHFLLNPEGMPMNFQFGPWARYSQSIQPLRVMNCAMWHAPMSIMLAYSYQIGTSPFMFDVSTTQGWDIDTQEEFEIAKVIFGLGYSDAQQ